MESTVVWGIFYILLCSAWSCIAVQRKPNFLLILADDLGWGDLASYGHPTQEWNVIDEMARQGVRFTQFYSPSTFCTPSRAALLTGRHPVRMNMYGDLPVFLPSHSTGLPKEEITLAEILRDNGYHTGMVGKWHLGINQFDHQDGGHLPHHHGFQYVGTLLPFSLESACDVTGVYAFCSKPRQDRCFLYRNTTIVEQPLTFHNLTASLIEDTKVFLYDHFEKNAQHSDSEGKGKPFFFYLSLPQPHTPMFNDQRFKGKSRRGVYGDQIEEMSWAINETLLTLRELGLEKDTLVVFLSDHGPHREMCAHGGSTGPFRGGKGNLLEGGLRIPAIAYWPGTIQGGQLEHSSASLMDIYRTFTQLAGIQINPNVSTDSHSLVDILFGKKSPKMHEKIIFFYCQNRLSAVRYKSYKIHFYYQKVMRYEDVNLLCKNGIGTFDFYIDMTCEGHILEEPLIYNVEHDPGELYPLDVTRQIDLLKEVKELIEDHKKTVDPTQTGLFTYDYTSERLVPCCNPPFCSCQ